MHQQHQEMQQRQQHAVKQLRRLCGIRWMLYGQMKQSREGWHMPKQVGRDPVDHVLLAGDFTVNMQALKDPAAMIAQNASNSAAAAAAAVYRFLRACLPLL
jgi:hypothetical protein